MPMTKPTSSQVTFTQAGTSASTRTSQEKLQDVVSIKDFGAVGNGTTNDTVAIQAAITSLGASGGTVVIPNGMRCLIDSSLTINANVCLKGPHAIVGSPGNNLSAPYGSVGGALLINSASTITLKGGASLQGLLIHRKGMTFPAANTSAYAGAAVTIGGDDAAVFQCMILGFSQAITSSNWQRPRIYDVNIDCLAGILIDTCYDIAYLSRVHCWPFATIAALGASSTLQRSGAAFKFTAIGDWSKITDCFSYGYARGYWISSCNSMSLISCSADSTGGYAGQIGFNIDGTSTDTRLVACQAAAQETGYRIATSAGVHTRMIGCDSWACSSHGILIDFGDVYVSGGINRDTPNGVTVNNGTSVVFVDATRFYAISGTPVNLTTTNPNIHLGTNNDYGNFASGNSVTNNTNKTAVSLTAADPINLPARGMFFVITGNTSFGTINGGWAGRLVVLKFTGTPTVGDGGASLKLNGDFVASADDTLTLMNDGSAWFEVARSAN